MAVHSATVLRSLVGAAPEGSALHVTVPVGLRIALGGTPVAVSQLNLTVSGQDLGSILDGEGLSRLFVVSGGGLLELRSLRLTGGRSSAPYTHGGGILVTGAELRMRDVMVDGCAAAGYAGCGGLLSAQAGATIVITDAMAVNCVSRSVHLSHTLPHHAVCWSDQQIVCPA